MDPLSWLAVIAAVVGVVAGLAQIFGTSLPELVRAVWHRVKKVGVKPSGAMDLAMEAITKENWSEAAKILQRLVGYFPNDYEIHTRLGIAEAGCHHFANALDAFATAIALGDTRASTRLNYATIVAFLDGTFSSEHVSLVNDGDSRVEIHLDMKKGSPSTEKEIRLPKPPIERIDVPAMQPPLGHFGVVSNVKINGTMIEQYLSDHTIEALTAKAKEIILGQIGELECFVLLTIEDYSLKVSGHSCDWVIARSIAKSLDARCRGAYILGHDQVSRWLQDNENQPVVFCSFSARNLPFFYENLRHHNQNVVAVFSILGPNRQTITQRFHDPQLHCVFLLDELSLPPLGEICH